MITADFSAGYKELALPSLYQWDYGQQIQFANVNIPDSVVEVHFANKDLEEAIVRPCTISGGTGTVAIPDVLLEQDKPIAAWISETDGEQCTTLYKVIIPVLKKAKPNREDVPQDTVDQYAELIAELNAIIADLSAGIIPHAKNADYATSAGSAGLAERAMVAYDADTATTAGGVKDAHTQKRLFIAQMTYDEYKEKKASGVLQPDGIYHVTDYVEEWTEKTATQTKLTEHGTYQFKSDIVNFGLVHFEGKETFSNVALYHKFSGADISKYLYIRIAADGQVTVFYSYLDGDGEWYEDANFELQYRKIID